MNEYPIPRECQQTLGIKPLFSSVSFGLDERDKLGVIAANGSGKSTLLRLISGAEHTEIRHIRV